MNNGAIRRKLSRGAVSGGVRAFLAIPVYLLLTPFVARSLGPEQFGVWAFGSLLVNVFSFTDFGLTSSLTYHTAREADDVKRVDSYFNAVFWTYLAIALIVFASTMAFAGPVIEELLRVPVRFRQETAYVMTIFAAGFGARFVAGAFQGVLEGYQEYAYSQLVFTKWLILNAVGTFAALSFAPTLYALGMVSLAGNLFVLGAFVRRMYRQFPCVRPRPALFKMSVLALMMRFGSGVLVASIIIAVREPLLKVLVARNYDLAAVAGFEISARLCCQVVAVVGAPMGGTFAASAYLSRDHGELTDLIRTIFLLGFSVFLPLSIFGLSFGRELMAWWLGRDFADAGRLFPAMLIAFSIYYMTEPLYKALQGTGHSRYSAAVQGSSLLISLFAFAILVKGFSGAVTGYYLAGFIFFSIANYWMFRKRFPGSTLIRCSQWIWLITPAILFLMLRIPTPAALLPVLFAGYLFMHIFAVHMSGVVDLFRVLRAVPFLKRTGRSF